MKWKAGIKDFCVLLGCYGLVYGLVSICEQCTGWWKGIIVGIAGIVLYEVGGRICPKKKEAREVRIGSGNRRYGRCDFIVAMSV